MPKLAMDYSKTIIYKIVCNDLSVTDVYVGHTTNITKRKYQHKYCCHNENDKGYNLKVYRTIREHGGFDNWSMIEIEKYPCNDINEAQAKERYWFEALNAQLNTFYPQRTKLEYAQDNKEKIVEYGKVYYEQNKEIIKQKVREWVCQNKEYVVERNKQYREKNKEAINARKAEAFTCDCGSCLTMRNKSVHLKSIKHQQYLNSLKQDKLTSP